MPKAYWVSTYRKIHDPEKLAAVVEQSRRRSAVYDVLTNGVPVDVSVDAG